MPLPFLACEILQETLTHRSGRTQPRLPQGLGCFRMGDFYYFLFRFISPCYNFGRLYVWGNVSISCRFSNLLECRFSKCTARIRPVSLVSVIMSLVSCPLFDTCKIGQSKPTQKWIVAGHGLKFLILLPPTPKF